MFPSKDVSPRWGMDCVCFVRCCIAALIWQLAHSRHSTNEWIHQLTPRPELDTSPRVLQLSQTHHTWKCEFINLFPDPLLNTNATYPGHQALQFLIPPSPLISDGSTKPAIFVSLSLESTSALIWPLISLSYATVAVSNFRTWVYLGERLKIKQASDSSKEWKGPWQKAEGAQRTMWLTFCLKEMRVLSQKSW